MSSTNGVGQNSSDIYTALGLNAPNSDTSKKKRPWTRPISCA